MVPPAQAFLQEADARARLGEMRIAVRPRPDQPLLRAGEAGEQPRDGVGVAVGPAADGIDGAGDVGVVLAHRAVLPERVAALVLQPVVDQQRLVLQPLQPHLAPALADQRRVRRMRLQREHGRGPGDVVDEHAAAHGVDVVGIAVVGRAQGDDGLQLRRPPRRHLQAVEAAPGDADHAAGPRAPGLLAPATAGPPGSRPAPASDTRRAGCRRIRRCRGCRRAPRHSRGRRSRGG